MLSPRTERAGDHVHLVHDAVALADAGTVLAVQTHRMHLVDERQRAVRMRDVAQLLERADRACAANTTSVRNRTIATCRSVD